MDGGIVNLVKYTSCQSVFMVLNILFYTFVLLTDYIIYLYCAVLRFPPRDFTTTFQVKLKVIRYFYDRKSNFILKNNIRFYLLYVCITNSADHFEFLKGYKIMLKVTGEFSYNITLSLKACRKYSFSLSLLTYPYISFRRGYVLLNGIL